MTEADWLSSTDPVAMLSFLQSHGIGTGRKLRLFAVACARRMWPLIDDLGRAAVEVAELFADGRADVEDLRAARLACKGSGPHSSWYAAATDPAIAARNAALSAQDGATDPQTERLAQAEVLRDIVANPFRPVVFDLWRTPEVVGLARAIYHQGDFTRMPELADALQQAGCTNDDVLGHCRGGTEHRMGCWLVDLVLSKTCAGNRSWTHLGNVLMPHLIVAALLVTTPTGKEADQTVVTPADVKWVDAPPSLPKGAQVAVREGDPAKDGPFVMRVKLPDGFRIMPHTHPKDERVTVLSGTLYLGVGATFDQKRATEMPAGSYGNTRAGVTHFGWVKGETVLQLHGTGPWAVEYANPADDPRKK